jgi:hypothetical protein
MPDIHIDHFKLGLSVTRPFEMAKLAGGSFPIADRVPDAKGEAFDWHSWYSGWLRMSGQGVAAVTPSHLIVEAVDTFEAVIPWEQLGQAAVLFSINGEPLTNAGPIRLYVPNGSSKCLNVKSIVKLKFDHQLSERQSEATYGFKHTFTAQDLRMNK